MKIAQIGFGILILTAIAFFTGLSVQTFLNARTLADSSKAPDLLREYAEAEATYRRLHGRYASISELVDAGLLMNPAVEESAWSDTFEGVNYQFTFSVTNESQSFTGTARPLRWYGERPNSFFIASDGKLRFSQTHDAGPTDQEYGLPRNVESSLP